MPRKNITILGAGYGGLVTALLLEKRPEVRKLARIRLVDKRPYHLLQSELHAVAAGLMSPKLAALSLNIMLKNKAIEFVYADVTAVDLENKRLVTNRDAVPFDYLVLAPGSVSHTVGIPGMDKHAAKLKSLDDALGVRAQVLDLLRDARHGAEVNMVVVGAGPTGVELSAYLADRVARAEFPAGSEPAVTLIEGEPLILPRSRLTRSVRRRAQNHMQECGVKIMTGTNVKSVAGGRLIFTTGEELKYDLLVWAGGVRACDVAAGLAAPHGPLGRVDVSPKLSLAAYPKVYVVGDSANMCDAGPGPHLPCSAQFAVQQAETAAHNIEAQLTARHPRRDYAPQMLGEFVSIGGDEAVAWVGPLQFIGAEAQLMKKGILAKHLAQIGVNPVKWFAEDVL